jgi:hypothetical protein
MTITRRRDFIRGRRANDINENVTDGGDKPPLGSQNCCRWPRRAAERVRLDPRSHEYWTCDGTATRSPDASRLTTECLWIAKPKVMIIALATPRVAASVDEGLDKVQRSMSEAAAQGAAIVCFPEAYLPGLRGLDFDVPPFDSKQQERVLATVAQWARTYRIATILGMEWHSATGRQIAAAVLGADGVMLNCQTKNQLDPTEEPLYVPGHARQIFEVNGVQFGIAICHEAFRYPETVRWAAVRGAKIVFHPHCTGSDRTGAQPTHWGAPSSPYYDDVPRPGKHDLLRQRQLRLPLSRVGDQHHRSNRPMPGASSVWPGRCARAINRH